MEKITMRIDKIKSSVRSEYGATREICMHNDIDTDKSDSYRIDDEGCLRFEKGNHGSLRASKLSCMIGNSRFYGDSMKLSCDIQQLLCQKNKQFFVLYDEHLDFENYNRIELEFSKITRLDFIISFIDMKFFQVLKAMDKGSLEASVEQFEKNNTRHISMVFNPNNYCFVNICEGSKLIETQTISIGEYQDKNKMIIQCKKRELVFNGKPAKLNLPEWVWNEKCYLLLQGLVKNEKDEYIEEDEGDLYNEDLFIYHMELSNDEGYVYLNPIEMKDSLNYINVIYNGSLYTEIYSSSKECWLPINDESEINEKVIETRFKMRKGSRLYSVLISSEKKQRNNLEVVGVIGSDK